MDKYNSLNTDDKKHDDEFEGFLAKEEKEKEKITYESPIIYQYKQLVVATLDLLGITNEILKIERNRNKKNDSKDKSSDNGNIDKESNENELIEKMISIKNMITEIIGPSKIITMLYISDSFIFVCEKDDIILLLKQLAVIQFRILSRWKTLLRGAIEFGGVTVEDSGKQIIGPAFLKAFKRQENEAIFPRILLGNSVINILNELSKNTKKNLIDEICITTRDKETSIDYIECFMITEGKNKNHIIDIFNTNNIYDFLYVNLNEYNKKDEMNIRNKYAWTIKYLREKEVWKNGYNECENW